MNAPTRISELVRSRAYFALSEDDCLSWFGVGRATLERIEGGEVEPSPETAARIDRFLEHLGGGPLQPPATPRPQPTHGGGHLGGGAQSERNGGTAMPPSDDRPAATFGDR